MKKLFVWISVLLCSVVFFSTPKNAVTAQGVHDFTITDYAITYALGKDQEGRSTLKTEETIVANFQVANQNHGIERAIPKSYDRHTTSLEILSVTDQNDRALKYTTYTSNDNEVVRIGDAEVYVYGLQTYKIAYVQRDVTKYFSSTNRDEFYWDTNGTEWKVPIQNLRVALNIDSSLTQTNNTQCYIGSSGSSQTCTLNATDTGYEVSAQGLMPYENITLAIGFEPQTFAQYKKSTAEQLVAWWLYLGLISGPLAIILLVWFASRAYTVSNRVSELITVVPEYLPPKDVSVSAAGTIFHRNSSIFGAQLVDLAVRHYIKIYQTREKSFWRSAQFELEIIRDISTLKEEEQEVLRDIFQTTTVGSRLNMATLKNNTSVGRKILDNQSKLNKNITGKYGLRARDEEQFAWFKKAARWTFLLAVVLLSPWLLVVAVVTLIIAHTLKPLTKEGVVLSRYLKGLDMYIKLAETERIQMLQSPEGAAKLHSPVDTNDKRQLIKLYERVLPYAVLFGYEKEWNKQLSVYYQDAQVSPTWYAGSHGAFSAAAFSSAVSSFSTAASSSSGGSSGGGSSGGGGGGGW